MPLNKIGFLWQIFTIFVDSMRNLFTIILLGMAVLARGASYSSLIEKADDLQAQERLEEAVGLFNQARALCEKENPVSQDMQYILISIAVCNEALGLYENLIDTYTTILNIADKVGFHQDIPEETVCFNIARGYINLMSSTEELSLAESLLDRADRARARDGEIFISQYAQPLRHKLNYVRAAADPDLEKAVEVYKREYNYFVNECPLSRDEIGENIFECGVQLATGYMDLRDNQSAMVILEDVERLVGASLPDDLLLSDIYVWKMYALLNLSREGECIDFGNKILSAFPETEETYISLGAVKYNMGRALNQLRRHQEALDLIESIYSSPYAEMIADADTDFVKCVKATALDGLGRHDEAVALCMELVNNPHDWSTQSHVLWTIWEITGGEVYNNLGYLDDFVELYDKMGKDDVQFASHFHHIARTYKQTYQHEKALQAVEKALYLYEKGGETENADYLAALCLKGALISKLNHYDLMSEVGNIINKAFNSPMTRQLVDDDIRNNNFDNSSYMLENIIEMLYMWFSYQTYLFNEAIATEDVSESQKNEALNMLKSYQQQLVEFPLSLSDDFKEWQLKNNPNWYGMAYFYGGLSYRDMGDYEGQITYLDARMPDVPADCEMYSLLQEQRNYALINAGHAAEMTDFLEDKYSENIADLQKMLNAFTSDQRSTMWAEYFGTINNFTEFAVSADSPRLNQLAYDAALVSKGLLLQSDIDFETRIRRSGNAEALAKFEQWQQLNQQNPKEAVALERELIRLVGTDFQSDAFKTKWTDIRNALAPGEYAIEIRTVGNHEPLQYYGLVVGNDYDSPRLVKLCNSTELRDLGQGADFDFNRLSSLVWSPLADIFPKGSVVYFSPELQLHSFPLENLPDFADGSVLIGERWNLKRVSSTRQLAMREGADGNKKHVEIYGGLDYTVDRAHLIQDYNAHQGTYRSLFDDDEDENLRGSVTTIHELPGSKREIAEIQRILAARNLPHEKSEGAVGTEAHFKATAGKKGNILHISTHGFFLSPSQFGKGKIGKLLAAGRDEGFDDALRGSGLMMAGVNEVLTGRVKASECEDGLLTAKEISLLDLSGIDLAVLSACETGVGAVNGDGVFGLQRGFKLAGVRSMMMSLWKVDDDATEMLMTEFYNHWVADGDASAALSAAQAAVRAVPGWESPRYWAAFVLLDAI